MANVITVTSGGTGYFGTTYSTNSVVAGQWYADGVAIAGATSFTYVLEGEHEGKAIEYRETGGIISNAINLFTPWQLSGLVLDCDASMGTTISQASAAGRVSGWASRVGSLTLSMATAGNQPGYSLTARNGKPGVTGNGTDRYMIFDQPGSLPSGSADETMAALAFFNNVAGQSWRSLIAHGSAAAASRQILKRDTDPAGGTTGVSGTDTFPAGGATWVNADKIDIVRFSSTQIEVTIDGQHNQTRSASINTGSNTVANLFRFHAGTGYWNGVVQEIIIFNRALSTDERQKVEGYLAHKWGTLGLLASGHPYKTTPPEAVQMTGEFNGYLPVTIGVLGLPNPVVGVFNGYLPMTTIVLDNSNNASGALLGFMPEAVGEFATVNKASGTLLSYLPQTDGGLFSSIEIEGVLNSYLPLTIGNLSPTIPSEGELFSYLPEASGSFGTTNGATATFIGYLPEAEGTLYAGLTIGGAFTGYLPEALGELGVTLINVDINGDIEGYLPTTTGHLQFYVPMLVVEDGTVIAGANSYVTVEEWKAWALARGVEMPANEANIETWLIKAFDYIELLRDRYKGETTTGGQALAWPRKCMYYEGVEVDENSIPARLKQAQIQLAIYASKGIELSPINEGTKGGSQFLIKQKLGPIEREYSEAAFLAANQMPSFYPVDKLLAAFMRTGFGQLAVSRA